MKKKLTCFLAIVTAVCLLMTQMVSMTSFALTDPTVSVSSTEAYITDESFDVLVKMENNPGIVSMMLTIGFDADAMELIGLTDGEIVGANVHSPDYNVEPYTLCWANDTVTTNFTANGTLATLKFKFKTGAVAGNTYPITVSYTKDNAEIIDVDMNEVPFKMVNGSVKAAVKPVAVTGVTLDKTTATVKSGATEQLTAIVAPTDATNKEVTWISSNATVATVSATGLVTAVKEGTATITATTKDGSKTATCAVTVTCAHSNFTKTEAKSSTCQVKGNNEYYTCDACGKVFKADKTTLTTIAAETLPLAAHKGVKIDKVDATHDNNGNIVYYTCSVCGKIFSDAACTKEIKLADTVIPALGHTTDGTWVVKTPATCTTKGVEVQKCGVCGEEMNSREMPLADHKGVKTDKVAATHDDKGNIEYYTCSVCGKIFSDAACTKEIKLADTVIPALGHTTDGTWVVKTPATCTAKGVEVQKCGVCGEEMNSREINALGHTFGEWTITKEATVTEKGERTHECLVCHVVDTEEIPMLVKEVVSADKDVAIEVTGDDTLTGYTKVTVANVTTTDDDGIEGKKTIKGFKFKIVDSDTNQAIDGTKTVKAKIKIDDISTSYKNLQVVIDGQVVDSEIDTEGYIVFSATADQLAKVVLVGDEYESEIGGSNDDGIKDDSTTSPKTGEATTAALAVAILSAAVATVVLTKKKRA